MGMVGDYQLEVLTRDGTTPLAQVHHDGRTYVVAEPGAAYKLRLTGSFKRQEGGITVVRAYIDGKSTCPGFYKHGSSYPSQVLFPGWLASATATSRVFRDFLFAGAQQDGDKHAPQSMEFEEGRIEIKFYGARDTGVPAVPFASQNTEVKAAAIPKLREGKKFFLAPSLTTGAGAKSEQASNPHANKLSVDAEPMKTLTLHYETAGTLLLRGILSRNVAAHAAILDACPETRWQEEEEEEEEEAAGGSAAPRNARGSRAGQRVKRERGPAVEVDLTRAPLGDEVAAAARQNKVLCCDLTDDAEPQWVAVKKNRV